MALDFYHGHASPYSWRLYPYLAYVARITVRKPETRLVELVPEPVAEWSRRIEAMPYYDKTFPPHWR